MKISQVIIRFLPAIGGGVQHVKYLSEALSKRGREVHIYTSYLIDNTHEAFLPPKQHYSREIKIYRYKWIKMIPGRDTTYIAPKIFFDILANNYDIVHVHGFRYFPVYGGAFFSMLSRVPILATFHHTPESLRRMSQKIYDTVLLKYLANNFSKIIVLTNFEKKWFILHGIKPYKLRVIPNGLPSSYFKEADSITKNEIEEFKERYNIKDKTCLIYVGRLEPIKNLEVLVRALQLMPSETKKKIRLLIVGPDWGYKQRLINLAREANVLKNIIFLGKLLGRKKILALRSCDIFVLPSIREVFSIATLEAMAAKLPVLATKYGGIKEVVRDKYTGYLLDPLDPEEWARYITNLSEDSHLRTWLGKNGRSVAERYYNWDQLITLIEQVYEEALYK